MVAISVPQPTPDDWSPPPDAAPRHGLGRDGSRPAGRRAGLHAVEPRRLPGRATRIRRRRLAVLVLAVLALMAAVGLARVAGTLSASSGDATPPSADQPAPPRAGPGEVYVVQPGDTYWTIAAQLSPGDDPRPIVDRLQEANGGASLDVGDRLVLDVE